MRPSDPRLRRQLAPAATPLTGVLLAGLASGALLIAQAWVVAGLVVAVLGEGRVLAWAGLVTAVFALRGLAGWSSEVAAARAAAVVGTCLRRRIITAVLDGTSRAEPAGAAGEVSVLATRGVSAAEPYLTRYLPAVVLAAVLPVLTVIAIATQDLLSAVIVLATLPLVPVFGALVGLATRDRAARQWRAMSSLSSHFLDVVRGLPTLVVHRRATAQSRRIADFTDRYRAASLATLRLAFASSAVLELVATISVALVAVVVGVRLAGGGLDLHTALVVLLLAPEAYWPLRRVGAEFHAAAEGIATFERVDSLTGHGGDGAAPTPPTGDQDLVVTGLTVQHPGRGVVLRDLDLRIPAGGVTVLTGPSGCGKTTLLSAIAGLVGSRSGTITVAGRDVRGPGWQEQVSLLPQRPVFVAGSISANLRLAVPGATETELWEALRQVALEERVRELPRGLDSVLGEDGATLSAGERARLALARVVLAARPWVLLDEPTAHLDPVTEQVILDTVVALGRTSTVVVVAHRPAALRVADTVLALPAATPPEPARVGPTRAPRRARSDSPPAEPTRPLRLIGSTLLGAGAAASGVALTATAGWLIVQASTRPAVLTLLVAIVGVRTFGLARPVLRYAERLRSHDAALRLLARRRVEVYDALVPLVPGGLGRRRGELLASVVEDVDSVVDRALRVRLPVHTLLLVGALAGAAAWVVLPVAALTVTAGAVGAAGSAFGLARLGAGRSERRAVQRRAALFDAVVEVVQTAPELVMWQAGRAAADRVAAVSDQMGRALVRSARWTGAGRAAALLVSGLAVAATALAAAPPVAAGTLSGPAMALLVLLPLALAELCAPLADAGSLAARTTAAARRLRAIEEAAPPVVESPTRPRPRGTGLELDSVTAGWAPGHAALEQLSLSLPSGSRIGVTGRSGSGKSTLAAVLLRFLDPTRGRVDLGGTPTAWLRLDDLRSVVGLVDDDPHVFATTLVENVRLARPDASDSEVETALREARLGDWLDTLPEGLDTWLGDGHGEVSGGERARLAVARALLADQRVLVLDEPVAHLDHATATALAEEVLGADRTRSVVWITHSPVGLDLVDTVVELATDSEVRPATRTASPSS